MQLRRLCRGGPPASPASSTGACTTSSGSTGSSGSANSTGSLRPGGAEFVGSAGSLLPPAPPAPQAPQGPPAPPRQYVSKIFWKLLDAPMFPPTRDAYFTVLDAFGRFLAALHFRQRKTARVSKISACPKVSKSIQKIESKSVQTCPKVSKSLQKCPYVSKSVQVSKNNF